MVYILIIILSAIAQYFGPWWLMPIVCFALSFWKSKSVKEAFLVAFAAVSTLWLGLALYQNFVTEGVITLKIAELFRIPNASLLFAAVTVVGGIVAGFAGMAGYYCRAAFAPSKHS
jgi:nucleoside permease NupC